MPYTLSFYVPETHVESVKNALFSIGAGRAIMIWFAGSAWGMVNFDR